MHARVSSYQREGGLSEAEADEITQTVTEKLLPNVRAMEGFKGILVLEDLATGQSMTVTLWESAESMAATEAGADAVRQQGAQLGTGEATDVQRYRVAHLELV